MSFEEHTVTIGDVIEKEFHGDEILIGMESSSRRSSQPRLLVTWRSTDVLTYIGEMSNSGMAMRLEITTNIDNVVPSGDEPISELISGYLSHIKCNFSTLLVLKSAAHTSKY